MDSHWEFLERTDGRTDARGWILRSQFRLKSGDQKWILEQKIFFEKIFFWKILSPTFHHHPDLALKNASRVVIPTENGQTVQFQVLKHLFLSSTPWRTTKKTYISIIRQIWKNSPEKGCFLALNVPGGHKPEFCQSLWQWFYIWYNCLHTLTEFQKKQWMDQMLWGKKCHF